eukprot:SAG31_NODE_7038_length_1807_cov_16.190867_2_plen_53_part_00
MSKIPNFIFNYGWDTTEDEIKEEESEIGDHGSILEWIQSAPHLDLRRLHDCW